MIFGSRPIMPWRCLRTGNSRPPERRSSNRWRQTRTTRMARMVSRMCATRAATRTRPAPFSRRGSRPRDGFFYGHLSWHLSLCEIQAGNWEEALRTYRDGIALDRHSGGPQLKIADGAAFLWRAELAGHPRDPAAWRGLYDYANSALPRPGNGLADLHVILAQAVMGDDAALDARVRQMYELAREGRYPSGSYLPALARGFASFEREDFSGAIAALAPLAGQSERIGGSRAQHDLIEFTLLRACLCADRVEAARHLLGARRAGAS